MLCGWEDPVVIALWWIPWNEIKIELAYREFGLSSATFHMWRNHCHGNSVCDIKEPNEVVPLHAYCSLKSHEMFFRREIRTTKRHNILLIENGMTLPIRPSNWLFVMFVKPRTTFVWEAPASDERHEFKSTASECTSSKDMIIRSNNGEVNDESISSKNPFTFLMLVCSE